MLATVVGNLTLVGVNTAAPKVFWTGEEVPGVVSIRVDWDADDQRVKLRVSGPEVAIYATLEAAGIVVKRQGGGS